MSDRARFARAALAIAAAYTAFLLCAQFGFLAQLEQSLGRSSPLLRATLAAMAVGGLAGSAAAALGRDSAAAATRRVRWGLLGAAIATAATAAASGAVTVIAAAAALGAALGFVTVALAGSLAALVPTGRRGAVVGVGTGAAYALSNLPLFFAGPPTVRALFPAALCALAAWLAPEAAAARESETEPAGRWALRVALFALLVGVDSAVFAHVQRTPELLAATWGGAGHQLRQGATHLVAALLAGTLLDRGRLGGLLIATCALFAGAFPALGDPATAGAAAVLYAAGISLYSAALVFAPSASRGGDARRRAATLYVVAGWIGSGLGVGAADAGFAARLVTPAVAPAASASVDPSALGRRVYLAEGCQHCHSQYVRPVGRDELWWGPRRALDRGERPPTPGNRRIGPDLSNAGLRRSALWHELHLRDPRALSPGSRMPRYAHLFGPGDARGPALVAYLAGLGAGQAEPREAAIAAWRPAAGPAGDALAGRELFARHCAACHGREGRGDGAAATSFRRATMDLGKGAFFRAVPARRGESADEALARAIRFGLAPGTMPGNEWLSERELADLVAFVRELARKGGG